MKRRRLESLTSVPGSGWTAICEENKAWHLPFRATEWIELPDLPPIDDTDASIAEIHNRPNEGCLTREEFVKDYDRKHGTDMAKLSASFFDPSLGQPWPEDQASDRPAASSEPVAYQGLGRQDLPIRDWANLAGKVTRPGKAAQ